MRLLEQEFVFSASDIANFLDCEHLATLDLQALLHPEQAPERTPDSDDAMLIQNHAYAHEQAYLQKLIDAGRQVTDLKPFSGNLQNHIEATVAAMRRSDERIFQGALRHGQFAGYAQERPA